MKLLIKKKLFLLVFSCNFLFAYPEESTIKEYFCPSEMESLDILDWTNPTFQDYQLIQGHLRKRLDKILANPPTSKCFDKDLEGWITYRLGRAQLIDTQDSTPFFEIVYINNNPAKKDKCVVCYGSYNVDWWTGKPGDRDYKKGIDCMIKSLKASNFDGHFIYRIGGWPSLKRGRLKFADVPYAFKPFFIEEVRDLGYKHVLWLDSASMPVKSLDPIFDFIKDHGCCFFSQGMMTPQKINKVGYVLRSLGLPIKRSYHDIVTQVIGFDFDNPKACQLFDLWIEAAVKKVPFIEPSADQVSFAFLVDHLDLLHGLLPHSYGEEGGRPGNFKVRPQTIIFHQYDFLNPQAAIPQNMFK